MEDIYRAEQEEEEGESPLLHQASHVIHVIDVANIVCSNGTSTFSIYEIPADTAQPPEVDSPPELEQTEPEPDNISSRLAQLDSELAQLLPGLHHFQQQASGFGILPSGMLAFRYDLESETEKRGSESNVRYQVIRLESLGVDRFTGNLRLGELPQKVAETAALRICRGRPEAEILTLLDQLTATSDSLGSRLSSLFLIQRAAEVGDDVNGSIVAGSVVYKSRDCMTIFLPNSDGNYSNLCPGCRTFFSQLFGDGKMEEEESSVESVTLEMNPGSSLVTNDIEKPTTNLVTDFDSAIQENVKRKPKRLRGGSNKKLPVIRCSECCIDLRSQGAYKRHLRVWHLASAEDGDSGAAAAVSATVSKPCPFCTEVFPVKENRLGSGRLRHHLLSVHPKLSQEVAFDEVMREAEIFSLKCEKCGNSFSSTSSLENHQRQVHLHGGEVDSCHICGQHFKKGSTSLWGHMKLHDNTQFVCSICGAQFKVKSYLNRHLKSHDANKKKFECELCGDKFTRPYLVTQHQELTHHKKLAFKCEICGKSLRSSTFLKIHTRSVHSKERPFPCEFCAFRSSRVDNLNIHRTKVHSAKTKITRKGLVDLIKQGLHPFCKSADRIPDF